MQEKNDSRKSYERLQEQLHSVLSSLPQMEQEILKMRFGLGIKYSCTLEEVSACFNIEKEKIRQIEAKALRILRKKNINGFSEGEKSSEMPLENKNEALPPEVKRKSPLTQKQKEIMGVLNSLSSFDRQIVTGYYGLKDGLCLSEQAIYERFSIDQDYLNKLNQKVRRRLRHKPDLFTTI